LFVGTIVFFFALFTVVWKGREGVAKAIKVGADMESVLFTGSIYLRNMIFSELGFSLEDLDKSINQVAGVDK
jgi:hypothetical protein